MRMVTRYAAPLLAALLLAGCAAPGPLAALLPAENTATVETAPTPAPQELTAYASASLAPALQAYATAQGVTLTMTDDAAAADLLLTGSDPTAAANCLPVSSDTLLTAAAARAELPEDAAALPLGRSLYGYWASGEVLQALLGDAAVTALQNADWDEWSDFVETLSDWLDEPAEMSVTLNGSSLTLPAERPDAVKATGVFAKPTDRVAGYTAAVLAADGNYTSDALTGPVNGVYSAVTLEWDHMAADGENAVFRRAKLTDLLAEDGSDACQGLVLIPFKCELDESDLTTEDYNLTGLLDYPVLAEVGYAAVNADADAEGQKAAKSAILWLYSNGEGETALTETLGVITPWNTASDATTLGAMQVEQAGTGILPGITPDAAAVQALTDNELALQDSTKHTKAERTAFTKAVLEALGAAE